MMGFLPVIGDANGARRGIDGDASNRIMDAAQCKEQGPLVLAVKPVVCRWRVWDWQNGEGWAVRHLSTTQSG